MSRELPGTDCNELINMVKFPRGPGENPLSWFHLGGKRQQTDRGARYRIFVAVEVVGVGLTAFAGALAYLIPRFTGRDTLFGLLDFFDLGLEGNFPSYISSVNLLVGAALAALTHAVINLKGNRPSRYWLLLAAILAYLSVDEAAQIHDNFGDLLAGLFPGYDSLPERHNWLLAGVAIAAIMGLSLLKFLYELPRRLAMWFVVAGVVFAFGVLGMEFAGTLMLWQGYEPSDFAYQVRRWLEETIEMTGVLIFNCTAAAELAQQAAGLRIIPLETRDLSH